MILYKNTYFNKSYGEPQDIKIKLKQSGLSIEALVSHILQPRNPQHSFRILKRQTSSF